MTKMLEIGFLKNLPIENPESLKEFSVDIPTPTEHDLLVKIDAISVNPVDTIVRSSNKYNSDTPRILGFDGVGIVISTGSDVTLFKPGDRVYYSGSFDRPGSNSEYELVDERIVGKAPATTTDAQTASIPLTVLTAWEALFEVLCINPEDTTHNSKKSILLINGAGGAGSMATQLAHWAGLKVIASASRPETIKWVTDHGADYVVNHRNNLIDEVHNLGIENVDYIFDMHSVDRHWSEMTELIGQGGRIVSITRNNVPINIGGLKSKRASFGWEWVFGKSHYESSDMITQHKILNKVAQLVDAGIVIPTNTTTLSPINLANLRRGHEIVESGKTIGKVVLTNEHLEDNINE